MSDRFDSELRSGFQTLRRMERERTQGFKDVLGDVAAPSVRRSRSPSGTSCAWPGDSAKAITVVASAATR